MAQHVQGELRRSVRVKFVVTSVDWVNTFLIDVECYGGTYRDATMDETYVAHGDLHANRLLEFTLMFGDTRSLC